MARKVIKPMDDIAPGGDGIGGPSDPTGRKLPGGGYYPGIPPVSDPSGLPPYGQPVQTQSSRPKIAGIILIIVAVSLIANAVLSLTINVEDLAEDDAYSGLIDENSEVVVKGRVTSVNSTPIEGVSVRFRDTMLSTVTDSNGNFSFESVPTGKNILIVSMINYTSIHHRIYLEGETFRSGADSDYEITFVLKEGSGIDETGNYKGELFNLLETTLKICGVAMIIGAVITVASAYFAFKRRKFPLTLVGCIFGIILGMGLFFIATALSIIALILLIMSRKEFN